MNHSCACCWRLAWLLLAFCFAGTHVLADSVLNTEQCQKELGVWTVKVDQQRSRLKGSDEGIKRLSALDHYLETMKACVDRLPDLAGELAAQDKRLLELKMTELEPKQREVEQIRQTTEARFSQLLYERQSLQTEIDQHNYRPHIFSERQVAERANYIAETATLRARWQRLTEATR